MDCIKGRIECNSRRPVVAGVCCLLVGGGRKVGGGGGKWARGNCQYELQTKRTKVSIN